MHPYSQAIEPTATQEGEFSDGDIQINRARTILRSYWPNMVQRELLNILAAAGITPAQENYTQVKQSIQALINAGDVSVLQTAIAQDSALDTSLRTYIDNQITAAVNQAKAHTDSSFIGQITAGPYKTTPPTGWLIMQGQEINTTTYSALAAYIRANYSLVDQSTAADNPGAFKQSGTRLWLPDMRGGLFVRAAGGNAGVVGALQNDAMQNIEGQFTVARGYSDNSNRNYIINSATGAFESSTVSSTLSKIDNAFSSRGGQRIKFDASKSVRTATETRPVNVAWRYLIRAI